MDKDSTCMGKAMIKISWNLEVGLLFQILRAADPNTLNWSGYYDLAQILRIGTYTLSLTDDPNPDHI